MVRENFHIRRAVKDDARLLSEISGITFLDTFKGTCTDEDMKGFIETYFNVGQVYRELEDENDFYFIGFVGDETAGYIRMKEEKNEVPTINKYKGIELKRIYVLGKYQSQKIGAKLMMFVLDFAAEKNYDLVWLGVWEHNEKAKLFYERFGFQDSGTTHPFPIGNTPQTDRWYYKLINQQ